MGRAAKWPTGITERKLANGQRRFQLAFSFRGQPIRKLTQYEVNRQNAKYLERLRASIYMEIAQGTFRFGKYWPDSKEARLYDSASSARRPIGELLDEHITRLTERKNLEDSTIETYRRIVRYTLAPTFGHRLLGELTARDIEDWIVASGCAKGTIVTYLRPLAALYKRALRYQELTYDPTAHIRYDELFEKEERLATDDEDEDADWRDIDPFTLAEITQLVDAAQPYIKNLVLFACFTGVRPSELIALQWSDINFTARTATIARARDNLGNLKLPKTDKTRVIELRGPAWEAITNQRPLTQLRGDWVWLNRAGRPWKKNIALLRHWKDVLLPSTEVRYRRPYQMRHTFASQMLSRGEDLIWVAHMMGHKNFTMLEKVYHRWIPKPDDAFETRNDWSNALSSAQKRT